MARSEAKQYYATPARILHWVVVALLVGQWALASLASQAEILANELGIWALHKSFGITIFFIAVLRLIYRAFSTQPALPGLPGWQQRLSSTVHGLFYLLLFAMPLTGWLGSSAAAYSVSWFNVLVLPDLVDPHTDLEAMFFTLHHLCWRLLCFLAVMHLLAALHHHFVKRNQVLNSMLDRLGFVSAVMAALLVAVAVWLVQQPAKDSIKTVSEQFAGPAQENGFIGAFNAAVAQQQSDQLWKVDYENSYVRFTAEQAGAPFEGEFDQWQTEIFFSEQLPSLGSIKTIIDLGSARTGESERDTTLAGEAFFDVQVFPQAVFRAYDFSPVEDAPAGERFIARAQLDIKGVKRLIDFEFSISADAEERVLKGYSELNRLEFGVGTGEWLDTTWVGDAVLVEVLVKSTIKD